MSDEPNDGPTLRHTLHGDALSWLHLMLEGALSPAYVLPEPPTLEKTGAPCLAIAHPGLVAGDTIDLLDPEGVTLAHVQVTATAGGWVAGSVEPRSGFSIVDHVEHRASPRETADSWLPGQVWALWTEAPVPFAVREAARTAARAAGASIAEIVPIPTGRETSRLANLPARLALAEQTRDEGDRMVLVPWPTVAWDAKGVSLRAVVAAAYGATELLLAPGTGPDRLDSPLPIRRVDVPLDQTTIPSELLDTWVTDGQPLPGWAAEPPFAAELRVLHRPARMAGLTVLLSGLSGSGKSTVARALAVRLMEHESRSVSLLDGDVVRHHLSKGLGFSRPDRITNVLRIGFVASEITKAGGVAVCCPIAPYDETRRQVRTMVEEHGTFVLVHVATPLEECERRDRKGLYAKARRGEIPEFTGISDPYDEPTDAEIVIDTTGQSIEACVNHVYDALVESGAITSP
ncbi:MAG: adenylyl-sulfate kinase [Actinomycetes bacterium]